VGGLPVRSSPVPRNLLEVRVPGPSFCSAETIPSLGGGYVWIWGLLVQDIMQISIWAYDLPMQAPGGFVLLGVAIGAGGEGGRVNRHNVGK